MAEFRLSRAGPDILVTSESSPSPSSEVPAKTHAKSGQPVIDMTLQELDLPRYWIPATARCRWHADLELPKVTWNVTIIYMSIRPSTVIVTATATAAAIPSAATAPATICHPWCCY